MSKENDIMHQKNEDQRLKEENRKLSEQIGDIRREVVKLNKALEQNDLNNSRKNKEIIIVLETLDKATGAQKQIVESLRSIIPHDMR